MQWFRSWHGAPTDAKWLLIARKAGVLPGVVSALYWALLDYASQHSERGSVEGFDVETYAAFSGFAEGDIQAAIHAMSEKGVIDKDMRIAAWDVRQPKREDDSTPRVRAHRARRSLTDTDPCNEETQCNAAEHNATIDKIEEIEEIEEIDKEPAAAPKKKRAANSKPRPVNEAYELARVIADVCAMDMLANKSRLIKAALQLMALDPPATEELIRTYYDADVDRWWYANDWRGLKGYRPQPEQLKEHWGHWDDAVIKPRRSSGNGNMGVTGARGSRGGEATQAQREQWAEFERQRDAGQATMPDL